LVFGIDDDDGFLEWATDKRRDQLVHQRHVSPGELQRQPVGISKVLGHQGLQLRDGI
jgi:hypothetical protein